MAALVEEDEVGSVALFLEGDGDGARLRDALARAAERGVGVAVLKVGATAAGATAAAAHTGALAGDQRVFRALVEEAGGAWAEDVHDLLELAKALAVPGARRAAGAPRHPALAILTCSGGDSGLAADEAGRLGLPLATFGAATVERLAELLPPAATTANPLDYTAMIWGERERLAAIARTVAADPAVDQLLMFYDEPEQMEEGLRASWDAVRDGLADGAAGAGAPALAASTLPELLQDRSAAAFIERGVPAVAGLRTRARVRGGAAPAAGRPARLRAIAAAARAGSHRRGRALAVGGRGQGAARGARDRRAARARRRGRRRRAARRRGDRRAGRREGIVAGAAAQDRSRARSCSAWRARRRCARPTRASPRRAATCSSRRWRGPGVELLVAARRDARRSRARLGLGGVWTELLGDAAIVPLPASPERVEAALRSLRGARC